MNGNSSIERRYSFNIAQSGPVAESTLNGSSFSWGTSMSSRHRSTSSFCLNNTSSSPGCNKTILSSPKSNKVTKIDARIAADVQSKGLASRIVKYYESETRLSRSMSAHNLYSKTGQFPTVTLRKTELPYRATKQELSMIRIPPPEKSTFYGNRICSLLRSHSVIGLQSKRTEENRPIIHPPPTESDMAPTRSVLDVLKEISRKRINSDDLEAGETSKKYCSREINNFKDVSTCATSAIVAKNTITSQRFKRQRDCVTHQSINITEAKSSPEQAKKRVCNYNNDITSSLSSSLKSKCYGKKRASYNFIQTVPTNLESYEVQKAKMQRYHDLQNNNDIQVDMRFENLENNLKNVETTVKLKDLIATTPCVSDENDNSVPPQRTEPEPLCNTGIKDSIDNIQHSNKPRLTLFNKNYESEITVGKDSNESSADITDEENNLYECTGIPFVKPKKLPISGLKNPVIERTQKSKLALMLSGLRGELYQNSSDDNVDSPEGNQQKIDVDNTITSNITTISVSKTVNTISTTPKCVTLSNNSNNIILPTTPRTTPSITNNTEMNSVPTNTFSNKSSSPLVGLKLSQAKPTSKNDITSSVDASKTTDMNSKTNLPLLGGFSFSTTSTSLPEMVFKTTASNSLKSPLAATSTTTSTTNNVSKFEQPSMFNNLLTSVSLNMPTKNYNTLSSHITPTTSSISNTNATTSSISNTSNTTNSLKPMNAFTFGVNLTGPTTTSNMPTTIGSALLYSNNNVKSNTTLNLLTTSTVTSSSPSPVPIMSGSIITSTEANNTISSNTIVSTTSSNNTTLNLKNLTTTPAMFSFNEIKTSQPNASTTISTSTSYGMNNNTVIKSQSASPLFSFGSEPKSQNSASDDKNKSTIVSQNNSSPFSSNSSTSFGPPSFNVPTGTFPYGTTTNNSEKNIFCATNASSTLFGSSSQVLASDSENKSALSTYAVLNSSSASNISPAPFSFVSKSSATQIVNNSDSTTKGFSFESTASNSTEGGTFAFGNTIKPTSTLSNSSNTFGPISTMPVGNKNFTFSSTTNETGNNSTNIFGETTNKTSGPMTSPGGFSFGSSTVPKSSTFSFGTTGNSFPSISVTNKNSTSGFSFGSLSVTKPTDISLNKQFSFGTPQPQTQQQPLPIPNRTSTPSNIFGSSDVSKPAFNFSSGSSTNLQSVSQSNNVFAPPPLNITTSSIDRPIRRATRRLQK